MADFTKNKAIIEGPGLAVDIALNECDFSNLNATSGEEQKLLAIVPGAFVKNVLVIVETAEGSTATGTVGDEDDPDGYIASLDLNDASNQVPAGTEAYMVANGKAYPDGGYITLTPGANLEAAKIKVVVEYMMLDK